jgi:dipeptidyl aminopeptidase/acylaminoacyl peptidase
MHPRLARGSLAVYAAEVVALCAAVLVAQGALWQGRLGVDLVPAAAQSADTASIVYTRADGNAPWGIYVASPSGADEIRIAVMPSDEIVFDPRWSPDGSEIAYHTTKFGMPLRILRLARDGGTPTPVITDDGIGFDAGFPAWHPTLPCLAYAGDHPSKDGRSDLKVWCAGQGSHAVIVTDDRDESRSDWSPDGQRLAVESAPIESVTDDRSYWDIYQVNADGTGYGLLVGGQYSSECHPRFSRDGTRLAFLSYVRKDCSGDGTLRVMELATGAITDIVSGVSGPAAWSPDGQSLLVTVILNSGPRPGPGMTPFPTQPAPGAQMKGLYRVDLDTMSMIRLEGGAGGQLNKGGYAWGYGPDWWGLLPTPTPTTTSTPTMTSTPPPSPTATATRPSCYLSLALDGAPLRPAEATPTMTATLTPELKPDLTPDVTPDVTPGMTPTGAAATP